MKNLTKESSINKVRIVLFQTALNILKVFLLLISGYLGYTGIRYSYYSSKSYSEMIYIITDSAVFHILVFTILSFLLALFLLLWRIFLRRFNQEKICRIILFLACVWLTAMGLFYLKDHPYYPEGDQLNVAAGALYARSGDYSMFARGGYIGLYEQQKGLVFLYEIFFILFGDLCFPIVEYCNLCFMIATLVFGFYFLKFIAGKAIYRIIYCFMMMFCIPYIIYLPYAYGDLPSICFNVILFWAIAAYRSKCQKRYVFIGAVAASLALLTRTGSSIALIAVGIGMVLFAMEKISFRPLLAALCIIIVAWGSVKAVDRMYEYRSGLESGIGIPKILWIAMGLQETNGNPGVYNRYQQSVYEECGFEQEPAIQIGRQYISDRFKEFLGNPAYARYFFTVKVKRQWLEPLFEGLYATNTFREEEDIPNRFTELYYGDVHDLVWNFANNYQSVIYISFLFFAISSFSRKQKDSITVVGWIPLIAVVGGFLFCIIWESQCRYMLPYYIFVIIYAAVGMGKTVERICWGILRISEKIKVRTKMTKDDHKA